MDAPAPSTPWTILSILWSGTSPSNPWIKRQLVAQMSQVSLQTFYVVLPQGSCKAQRSYWADVASNDVSEEEVPLKSKEKTIL